MNEQHEIAQKEIAYLQFKLQDLTQQLYIKSSHKDPLTFSCHSAQDSVDIENSLH